MRLGLGLSYWSGPGDAPDNLALALEAERLGYDVVWVGEAYGSDAVSVLGHLAHATSTIGLGSSVFQIPARSAAMTAMTAATLDTLSGGRFRLGLGVSGPQVSEGWHGVPFAKPLGRTREYVDVVRLALAGENVAYEGEHLHLPLPGGRGKPLRLTTGAVREDLPVYLAAVGPANVALAGEIADGWLAFLFAPEAADQFLPALERGLAKAGRDRVGFDVCATVPLVVDDDQHRAGDAVRDQLALYVGGMGSREQNFYFDQAVRLGFEEQAEVVQRLYLSGDRRGAAAAVPHALIQVTSLVGHSVHLAERMKAYAQVGVTTLTVSCPPAPLEQRLHALRTAAEALDLSGARS